MKPLPLELLALLAALSVVPALAESFGPGGCVTLTRSAAGSCVFRLACSLQNLSLVEFAFDCESEGGGGVVRHSYGRGGFDPDEEFDSEVHCDRCRAPEAPLPAPAVPPPGPHALVMRSSAAHAGGGAAAVRYGPRSCVWTYRSAEGHCVMETHCRAEDLKNYSLGLVCVDKTGAPVRHVFGRNSFDPVETFDTLIACDQCLGLEDIPDGVAMNGQVLALSRELHSVEALVRNLTQDLLQLGEGASPPPQQAALAAAPTAAAGAAPLLLGLERGAARSGAPRRGWRAPEPGAAPGHGAAEPPAPLRRLGRPRRLRRRARVAAVAAAAEESAADAADTAVAGTRGEELGAEGSGGTGGAWAGQPAEAGDLGLPDGSGLEDGFEG